MHPYLFHLESPHAATHINHKNDVFGKRREIRRSEELDKMAIRHLMETILRAFATE